MLFVYVLQSRVDGNFYTGFTENLKRRLEEHNKGESRSTRHRLPLDLVYFEACLNRKDALHRERYLKTTYGHRYVRNRLKHYLEQ